MIIVLTRDSDDFIVHFLQTEKCFSIADLLVSFGRNVLIIGDIGVGKTSFVQVITVIYLRNLPACLLSLKLDD